MFMKCVFLFLIGMIVFASCKNESKERISDYNKSLASEDSVYKLYPELNETFDSAKFLLYCINWNKYILKCKKAISCVKTDLLLTAFDNQTKDTRYLKFEFNFFGEIVDSFYLLEASLNPKYYYPYMNRVALDSVNRCVEISGNDRIFCLANHFLVSNHQIPSYHEWLFNEQIVEYYRLEADSLNPWFREQLMKRGILKE